MICKLNNQETLVISGLFIRGLAYSRSKKIYQNLLFAVFPSLAYCKLMKLGLKWCKNDVLMAYSAPSLFAVSVFWGILTERIYRLLRGKPVTNFVNNKIVLFWITNTNRKYNFEIRWHTRCPEQSHDYSCLRIVISWDLMYIDDLFRQWV